MDPGETVVLVGGIIIHVGKGKRIPVVLDIHPPRQHQLPTVVHAHDALGLGLGLGQRGQQQAGQNGDDGNDDEQLDQRESTNRIGESPPRRN